MSKTLLSLFMEAGFYFTCPWTAPERFAGKPDNNDIVQIQDPHPDTRIEQCALTVFVTLQITFS